LQAYWIISKLFETVSTQDSTQSISPCNDDLTVLCGATVGSAVDDQNLQGRKEAFLGKYCAAASDDYLKSVRTPPLSQYEIKAGWKIPEVLEQIPFRNPKRKLS